MNTKQAAWLKKQVRSFNDKWNLSNPIKLRTCCAIVSKILAEEKNTVLNKLNIKHTAWVHAYLVFDVKSFYIRKYDSISKKIELTAVYA